MPQATIKRVCSVSSEDPAHPASNLLQIQAGKKWKTKTGGEKSAYVVLELSQPEKITGIDIGNEHAAFVEVLVGKIGCSEAEFKEILITSSFMTPIESKNSTNQNRVRCFGESALVKSIADEKWDLIKVICTQPFNRHVQYGLCFIKLTTAESQESKKIQSQLLAEHSASTSEDKNQTVKRFGKFSLRQPSPDSDSESSLSLFSRWKQSKDPNSPLNKTAAASIRDVSLPSLVKSRAESFQTSQLSKKKSESVEDNCKPVLDRNRNDLVFGSDNEGSSERLERKLSADQERLRRQQEASKKEAKKTEPKHRQETSRRSSQEVTTENGKESHTKLKRGLTTNAHPSTSVKRSISPGETPTKSVKKMKPEKQQIYRPFKELLGGVVLVISGIQNPDRTELRRKAVEMGAKYKPDWDKSCTHLICAFKGTPKYNQVRGQGKIISKQWIEKCYALKKRLPWRRYALEDAESEKPESEDEIHDLSLKPQKSPEPEVKSKSPELTKPKRSSVDYTPGLYDDGKVRMDCTSGSDTEDELERVRGLQTKAQKHSTEKETFPNEDSGVSGITTPSSGEANGSPAKRTPKKSPKKPKKYLDEEELYEISTDEEVAARENRPKSPPPLKEFFTNKKFYLNKLGTSEEAKIKSHIQKYGGDFAGKVTEADFVITKEPIAVPSDYEGELVKPSWIYECTEMEGFVPTGIYRLG